VFAAPQESDARPIGQLLGRRGRRSTVTRVKPVRSWAANVRQKWRSLWSGEPEPTRLSTRDVLIEEFQALAPEQWVKDKGESLPTIFTRIHELPPDQRPMALCLSGGGIRSATFSLGVIQSLAKSGRLENFHYLSTVSGGGYIGSWLSNWRMRSGWDWEALKNHLNKRLPKKEADRGPAEGATGAERDALSRLRAYSNYLSPVWGLSTDALSLVAIFLRNLLLNWLVWIPLIAVVVALPRLYVGLVSMRLQSDWVAVPLAVVAAGLVIWGIAYIVADLPEPSLEKVADDHKSLTSRFAKYCFAPVSAAAVLLSIAGVWTTIEAPFWAFTIVGICAHVVGILFGIRWREARRLRPRPASVRAALALLAATGLLGGVMLWLAFNYGAQQVDAPDDEVLFSATVSVPIMLSCFWLSLSLYAGLVGLDTPEADREWWSRATALWLYASLVWLFAFLVVVYLPPFLFDQLNLRVPAGAQLGVGGAVLGVITSAFGFWGKNGSDLKRRAQGIFRVTGLRLLDLLASAVILMALMGMSLLVSWSLSRCHAAMSWVCPEDIAAESRYLRDEALLAAAAAESPASASPATTHSPAAQDYLHVLLRGPWYVVLVGGGLLFWFAIAASKQMGANTFSLHSMYGNRLVRAYLGAGREERAPHWFTGFDPKDDPPLTALQPPQGQRLLQVVNIALNLVLPSNKRLAWQQRKASSFTASPLHCGADGVGYVPSKDYGGVDGLTLGRAFTISGAAASPNMGYHSSGLVTLVMTLFNVRLGWWLPNPGGGTAADLKRSEPRGSFAALMDEAFGRTTDDRDSVYLSDGGHFENLGLYEMVRRRCHRIVVVDASCDPKFAYEDLMNAVRKIRVDFGISIELPPVLPGPGRTSVHPRRVVGRIRYSSRDGTPESSDGFLYLIKPRLIGDEPPDIAQYAASCNDGQSPFPHQSTADQFFDETQFESYRVLGLKSGESALPSNPAEWPDEDFRGMLPQPESIVAPKAAEGLGSLVGSVQSLGTGAALATALTVGGTLGVVGTVSLAPGEIRLSAQDREALEKGIKVNLALDVGQPAIRDLLERAKLSVDDLQTAAQTLREAALELRRGGGGDPGIEKALDSIDQTLRGIREPLGSVRDEIVAGRADFNAQLRDVNKQLLAMISAIRAIRIPDQTRPPTPASSGSGPASLDTIQAQLVRINETLSAIQSTVAGTNPRRNVRGQEGGSR